MWSGTVTDANAWRVSVDKNLCIGSAMCTSVAPDDFALRGPRAVALHPTSRPSDSIIMAREICPVEAISVKWSGTDIVPEEISMPVHAVDIGAEYADLTPLAVRIETHRRFSERPETLDADVLAVLALDGTEDFADVGCGSGEFLAQMQSHGHKGRLFGIDTSPAAVAAAAAVPDVAGVLCSADDIPLRDGELQRIAARHMLYHVPDPIRALEEFRRLLAPGGLCVAVVNRPVTTPRLVQLIRAVAWENGQAVTNGPTNPVHSENLPAMVESVFGNCAVETFDNALVFRAVDPLLRFSSAAMSFHGVPATGPLRESMETQIHERVRDEFERLGEWRDDKGYVVCAAVRA